jgi:hypothetical protein
MTQKARNISVFFRVFPWQNKSAFFYTLVFEQDIGPWKLAYLIN